MILESYHAAQGCGEKEYKELFLIEGYNKVQAETLAKDAVKMSGVFWSAKYKTVLLGVFRACKPLPFKEFKQRLINTVGNEDV